MIVSRMYKYVFVLALPLVLASCFSAKEYVRPEVVNVDLFRTDSLQTDSLTMAATSWKDLFTDPQLQVLIEEGLENNIDIRIAIQQINLAEAYLRQGKAGYFPTIGLNGTYTYQDFSENGQGAGSGVSSVNQYQLSGGLSWEADIWGKIRSNERAFTTSYLQSVAAHKAVKSRLVANIAATYFQLLSLDEQLAIAKSTIVNRENSLQTTKLLKDAGNLNEVGVKQTEAQYYTAKAIAVEIENQIHLLENSMSILLGGEPKEIARGELANQEITTELKLGVPIQLLQYRPDIMAAEYGLVNAFELTNVARSNFYPSFTLNANAGLQSLQFDNLFSASSLFSSIIGGFAQPILNGRKIRTQYEAAQARQEQAKLDFKYAVLNAAKEVSDALYNYDTAVELIDIKEQEYKAYTLATDYSEELLNNGFANYLEVLRARENQLNTSLSVVELKNRKLQAIIDLYLALGGGWE